MGNEKLIEKWRNFEMKLLSSVMYAPIPVNGAERIYGENVPSKRLPVKFICPFNREVLRSYSSLECLSANSSAIEMDFI